MEFASLFHRGYRLWRGTASPNAALSRNDHRHQLRGDNHEPDPELEWDGGDTVRACSLVFSLRLQQCCLRRIARRYAGFSDNSDRNPSERVDV